MYSPCLLISRVPKVQLIASSHRLRRYPRKHTRRKHWKAINGAPLLLRSNTRSKRQHKARQRDTDLSSRTVNNNLSGVSVTHDEYRMFTEVQVASLRLLTWQLKQAWHITQTGQEVKHKRKLSMLVNLSEAQPQYGITL